MNKRKTPENQSFFVYSMSKFALETQNLTIQKFGTLSSFISLCLLQKLAEKFCLREL